MQLMINILLVIFEKCAKLHLPRRLVQFWHIFQKSLVVLIINCTPSRVITYTNLKLNNEYDVLLDQDLVTTLIRRFRTQTFALFQTLCWFGEALFYLC